jgi:hypothetical protein
MLLFEGLIHRQYWAQMRPLGDLYSLTRARPIRDA